ncbi:MAG: pilus assembly protein TadG-related protein [Candidatus Acidiferrales bacterium]
MTRKSESGQVLVFAALALVVLTGFAGLAIDMGVLRYQKRLQQSAADAAAIAGASNLVPTPSGVSAGAQNASAKNGFTDTGGGQTSACTASGATVGTVCVQVNNPPLSGPHTNNANYVEVLVAVVQPTYFMRILGINSEAITARAVATNLSGGPGSGCVYALGQSNTDIDFTGNDSVLGPQCGIVDDGGMKVSGNVTVTAASIGVAGAYSASGNVSVTPTPVTGIPAAADPLAYLTPPTAGACVANPNLSGNGTVTLNPGNYCNGISITGNYNVTFSSGVYILGSGFAPTGNITLSGTGVTFYVTSGAISLTGNTTYNFSAPTSGALEGILFWQAKTDTSAANFTGNSSSSLEGALYFPGAQVNTTGNSSSALYTIVVAQSFAWTGNSSLALNANYNGLTNGSPIKSATLVE